MLMTHNFFAISSAENGMRMLPAFPPFPRTNGVDGEEDFERLCWRFPASSFSAACRFLDQCLNLLSQRDCFHKTCADSRLQQGGPAFACSPDIFPDFRKRIAESSFKQRFRSPFFPDRCRKISR